MAADAEHERLEATITGRVQGVYYRETTRNRATELGLTGWTKNDRDGSVTVMAEGPRASLEQLVEFLRIGPPAARVDDVACTWAAATGEFSDFRTRWW